jgi:hypothetical protein
MSALNRSRSRDLMLIQINPHDLSGRTNLFSETEGRNAGTTGDIQDGGAREQIEMVQQRLGKR